MPEISVIIPILNEEKYIKNLLDSIVNSRYDKSKMEVFLIDGGSQDKTIEIVKDYQKRYPFLILLDNPEKIVPTAMNIGIKRAKGKYIIRLDAHSSYPEDYFLKLVDFHQKLNVSNVGGVCKTEILNKTPLSKAIKKVLTHPFGVGNAKFRVGINKIEEVDTVPFGCYKREVFDKIGLYDERLIRNQDIELNKRLKRAGGKIVLVPDIEATYYAREDLISFVKNSFSNGRWNILTLYFTKKFDSISLRHFIPLLFLLSLILPLILSPFFGWWYFVVLLSLGSYLILALFVAMKSIEKDEGVVDFLYMVLTLFLLHISYGFGSLIAIFEVLFKFLSFKKDKKKKGHIL